LTLISIDLAWLSRESVMRTGTPTRITWSTGDEVTGEALVSRAGDGLDIVFGGRRHAIDFRYTNARFGGRRRWFTCPRCDRGCRVLYFLRTSLFCRRCYGLGYQSEFESSHETALKRARAIAKKLGGTEMALPITIPPKPKRMHWSTYWRLAERCRELEQVWLNGCARELGILGPGPRAAGTAPSANRAS
jgi:hypothetical protein